MKATNLRPRTKKPHVSEPLEVIRARLVEFARKTRNEAIRRKELVEGLEYTSPVLLGPTTEAFQSSKNWQPNDEAQDGHFRAAPLLPEAVRESLQVLFVSALNNQVRQLNSQAVAQWSNFLSGTFVHKLCEGALRSPGVTAPLHVQSTSFRLDASQHDEAVGEVVVHGRDGSVTDRLKFDWKRVIDAKNSLTRHERDCVSTFFSCIPVAEIVQTENALQRFVSDHNVRRGSLRIGLSVSESVADTFVGSSDGEITSLKTKEVDPAYLRSKTGHVGCDWLQGSASSRHKYSKAVEFFASTTLFEKIVVASAAAAVRTSERAVPNSKTAQQIPLSKMFGRR